jgi:hypothetical protein
MSANDLDSRVRQLTWPGPSASLRPRVRALPLPEPTVSWPDRVWFSRTWRLGAVGVVAALVALEAWSIPMAPARVTHGRQVVSGSALALEDIGLPTSVLIAFTSRERAVGAWPAERRFDDWSTLSLSDLAGER